jgi:hypothetical protein
MPQQSVALPRVRVETPGLLRRRLIFADPERSVVRISHDGTRIAFRAPVDGVLNLWIARSRKQHGAGSRQSPPFDRPDGRSRSLDGVHRGPRRPNAGGMQEASK